MPALNHTRTHVQHLFHTLKELCAEIVPTIEARERAARKRCVSLAVLMFCDTLFPCSALMLTVDWLCSGMCTMSGILMCIATDTSVWGVYDLVCIR